MYNHAKNGSGSEFIYHLDPDISTSLMASAFFMNHFQKLTENLDSKYVQFPLLDSANAR